MLDLGIATPPSRIVSEECWGSFVFFLVQSVGALMQDHGVERASVIWLHRRRTQSHRLDILGSGMRTREQMDRLAPVAQTDHKTLSL
jgi:hypothetical protein